MTGLFDPGAPKLFTIAMGANFLDDLARGLSSALDLTTNPFALSDALVYLPNSRSRTAFGFALTRASARGACLLPDIRALGDLESDEAPPSAETAMADLPPVLSAARRIGELTRLVIAYYHAQDLTIPPVSAVAAARDLASLLDQAALSGPVDWDNLKTLQPGENLAAHWRQSLGFLKIITDAWPARLDELIAMDPFARRLAAARVVANHWAANPPSTPVIIAGSTGATPASRVLMRAALNLPQGLVILPGLDRDVRPGIWREIANTPSHPQFTLARTLADLGVSSNDVADWPGSAPAPQRAARRRLIQEALAPAINTADWTQRLTELAPGGDTAGFVTQAVTGLAIVEAANDGDEALAAALLMRRTLETDAETAALVTPDAGLARQVSVLLCQWGIEVAPSAGQPLLQTPAGSFACLVLDWMLDPGHPVRLMAMLNHPYCRLGAERVSNLDFHVLRRPRTWSSLSDLQALLLAYPDGEPEERPRFNVEYLPDAIDLLGELIGVVAGEEFAAPPQAGTTGQAWLACAAKLITTLSDAAAPWSGEDGASLSQTLRDLAELCGPLGPQPPQVFADLFRSEATRGSVRLGPPHPRLAIWGPLEARLQAADRIILAGLTEGTWPAQPPADAFLPRVLRQVIGLSDPDERIGLSAHDFAQLAAAPNVTLLTARRRADKPVVASRWIWRLRTLVRGALDKAEADAALAPDTQENPLIWIKALERVPALPASFTARPNPRPPSHARPKRLSVTRIETLVRDPYAIYAQYVLGLYKLDPLDLPTDVRLRGTAIHKALETFDLPGRHQTAETLLNLLETELRKGGESEANLIALRDKRLETAMAYVDWRKQTAHRLIGSAITEETGEITLQIAGEIHTLRGTADRIEKRAGGGAAIIDFKSGKPPTEAQVRSGLAPQMPLQGLIAERGGYKSLGRVTVDALTYIQFGSKFEVTEIGKPGRKDEKPVAEIIAEAERGLIALLTTFANPDKPYLSAPAPERVSHWSDYTRLARREEWVGLDTYD